MMGTFRALLLLGVYLLHSFAYPAYGGDICPPECISGECKQVECIHGECGYDGTCLCLPCFGGETCDTYYDDYPPYFQKLEEVIYVKEDQQGEIYLVNAMDEDFYLQCMESRHEPCPCSSHQYDIVSGTGFSKFDINETTGQISVAQGEDLYAGEEYEIKISVSPNWKYGSIDIIPSAIMSLQIIVRDNLNQQDISPPNKHPDNLSVNELKPHIRKKREPSGNLPSHTTVSLNAISEPTEPVHPGDAIGLEMTITLPEIDTPMDLTIELILADLDTDTTAFALCSATITHIGDGIMDDTTDSKKSIDDIVFQKIKNDDLPVVDRLLIPFGFIYNTDTVGSGANQNSDIVIAFSITMIINPLYTDSDFDLTLGAIFDGEKYLHVFQVVGTLDQPDLTSIGYAHNFYGADAVSIYGSAIFRVEAFVPYPSGPATIEVFTIDEIPDLFSFETLSVNFIGAGFGCVGALDGPHFVKSPSGYTNGRATVSFFLVASGLDKDNYDTAHLDDAFKMTIDFSVFFPGPVGKTVNICTGMYIDGVMIWTACGLVEITDESAPAIGTLQGLDSFSLATSDGLTNPVVNENGAAAWALKFSLPRDAQTAITCSITPSADHIVCGIREANSGANLARRQYFQDSVTYADGGASFSFIANTSAASADVVADTSEDYLRLEITICYNTTSPEAITVDCDSHDATLTATYSGFAAEEDVEGVLTVIGDETVVEGSAVTVRATLTFGSTTGFSSVRVETAGSFDSVGYGAEVCSVKVSHIGNGLASILNVGYSVYDGITLEKTHDGSMFNDSAMAELGMLAAAYVHDNADYTFSMDFTYIVPMDQANLGEFIISVGFHFRSIIIWSGYVTLTLASGLPPYNADQAIRFTYTDPDPFLVKGVTTVSAYAKVYPGTTSELSYTIYPDNVEELRVCKVLIHNIGESFGCQDTEFYDSPATPSLSLINVEDPFEGAVLDFGLVSNLRDGLPSTYDVPDWDDIEIGVIVWASSDTASILKFDSYDGSVTHQESFTMPANQTGGSADVEFEFTVTGRDGTDLEFTKDVPKVVEFRIVPPEGYSGLFTFTTDNPNFSDMSICYASIVWAGENYPCFHVKDTNATSSLGTNDENVITQEMPMSLINISNGTDANVIIVRVGVLVREDVSSTSFNILVSSGSGAATTMEAVLSSGVYVWNSTNVSFDGLDSSIISETSLTGEPGDIISFEFDVNLPPGIFPLVVGLVGMSSNGQASATVLNLTLGSHQGANIGCLKDIDETMYTFSQNSSTDDIPMYHESQLDTLILEEIYVENSGLSILKEMEEDRDNSFSMMAAIMLADHEEYLDGEIVPVYVALRIDDKVIAVLEVNITLVRLDTHEAIIESDFSITDGSVQPTLEDGDTLDVTFKAWHLDGSRRELYGTFARIFLPLYVVFINTTDHEGYPENIITCNIPHEIRNGPYIDVHFDYLFFLDELECNISLTYMLDLVPIGLENVPSSTLLRIVGREGLQTNPYEYWPKPKPTKHINFSVRGTGCQLDLKIDTFDPCQFTASSLYDEAHGPAPARSADGWFPIVRGPPMVQSVIIDLLTLTRVTVIEFAAVVNRNLPKKYTLSWSNNGMKFEDTCAQELLTSVTKLPTECQVTARYIKIEIVPSTGDDETLPYGVRCWNLYFEMKNSIGSFIYCDIEYEAKPQLRANMHLYYN